MIAGLFTSKEETTYQEILTDLEKKVISSQEKQNSKKEQNETKSTASITLTGDLLYEQGLYDWMDNYSFGDYLDGVQSYLDSDLTIANQEVPIGGEELGVSGVAFTFNAPYEIANQYKDIGIDFVTTATNHTMDMGVEGIANTNAILDENGIGHTGSYTSEEERKEISYVEVNGIKIAILAYTYGTNESNVNNYDVNYFLSNDSFLDVYKDQFERNVEAAKKEADVVFVALHWGTEFTYQVTDMQKEVAQYLNNLGVDLIIGNHPHTIQPAETLVNEDGHKTVVFYSLGNFISSAANVYRASETFTNMYEIGALVQLNVTKQGDTTSLENIQIVPVVNHFESGYTNFSMIPFSKYTDELAEKHYQREYSDSFNISWLSEQIHDVFDDCGFLIKNI